MPSTNFDLLRDYATVQLAAEAFLTRDVDNGVLPTSRDVFRQRLIQGNFHASKFLPLQVERFLDEFEVLAQLRNDPASSGGAGFSGTLIRRRDTDELILSFRSTEFIDDSVRDSKATNDLELRQLGWGFGQIAEMEDWYAQLRANPDLLQGKQFTVTGYSLGGHLATAFNILRREAEARGEDENPVLATYTFNGAGVGELMGGASLTSVISAFRRYLDPSLLAADPYWLSLPEPERERYRLMAGARAIEVEREWDRIKNLNGVQYALNATEAPLGIQATADYQLAALLASRFTVPMASFPLFDGVNNIPSSPKFAEEVGKDRFPSMLELVGSDGGRLGPSFVSNSGIHYGNRQEIYIEDQPLERGTYSVASSQGRLESNPAVNDFADTHSLVLIIDSLGLMSAFETIDPSISRATINRILAASSNARVHPGVDDQHEAEGDTLERALDSLSSLILGFDAGRFDRYLEVVQGATWDDEQPRADFQAGVDAVLSKANRFIADGRTMRIVSLVDLGVDELVARAMERSPDGAAYRYALKNMSAFAVLGLDFDSGPEFPDLSLASVDTPGGMTEQYVEARALFLAATMSRNLGNLAFAPGDIDRRFLFEDRAIPSGMKPGEWMQVAQMTEATARIAGLANVNQLGQVARYEKVIGATRSQLVSGSVELISFGSNGNDDVLGGRSDDWLFGGDGVDRLDGGDGDDLMDGGIGADILYGGAGDDELIAFDGAPGDRLIGGSGYDTFYADWGDTISDTPGETRGGIVYIGPDKLQLTDGFRTGDTGYFQSSNGIRYWEAPDGRIVAYGPDGGKLNIEAPGGEVRGLDATGNLKTTGRPDLGIRLVSLLDERPRLRPDKDAIPSLWKLGRTWVAKGDPLALDLDGDGIETLGGESGRAVLFDHSADGVRDGSGWLTADDAWVALDLDGNGMVDSGRELFGTDTLLPSGAKARDGFEALAALDTNLDGRIDAEDETFADLLVWRDENLNGISEGFELQTFAEAGIASINLASTPSRASLPGGNEVVATGTYTLSDGTVRTAAALDLVRETYYRDYATEPDAAGDVGDLPGLLGSGRVRDLQEAAAESPEVAAAIEAVAAGATRREQYENVGALLDVWAGSSHMDTGRVAFAEGSDSPILNFRFQGLASLDPQVAYLSLSGGDLPLSELPENWFLAAQGADYQERVRKLEILERFTGQTLAKVGAMQGQQVYASDNGAVKLFSASYSVGAQNYVFLDQAYAALEEQTYLGIALETRLKPYVDAFVQGQEGGNFSALEVLLNQRRSENFSAALEDFVDLSRAVGYELVDRGWIDLMPMLSAWIREARADPLLVGTLERLKILFREDFRLEGAGTSDILFGVPAAADGSDAGGWFADGSFGDDLIFGDEGRPTQVSDGEGADLIFGGSENDTYLGGAGRDIYFFGRGGAHDVLTSEFMHQAGAPLDRDVLQLLPGITPDDILVRRAYQPGIGSYQLDVVIADSGDTFSDKFFFHSETSRLLDEIRFADGTRWNVAELRRRLTQGSAGDDNAASGLPRIHGTSADEILQGFSGDDILLADEGDDQLFGGPGRDVLEGYFGADLLDGGAGDDRLYGGHGVDTYVLSRGGGRDEVFRGSFISDAFSDTQELDVLRAGEGIAPADLVIQWTPDGTRFYVTDGSAEIWDWGSPFNAAYAGSGGIGTSIVRVEFEDGTVWDNAEIHTRAIRGGTDGADILWGYDDAPDLLNGGAGDDVLRGQGGDDVLDGGAGNDLLFGGPGVDSYVLSSGGGNDRINDGSHDRIVVAEGISPNDLIVTRRQLDLTFSSRAGDASLTGTDAIERVSFADGTQWGVAEIRARISLDGSAGSDEIFGFAHAGDTIRGFAGDDSLHGLGGDDVLIGGQGNDVLDGGAGEDTYVFGRGDGVDTIDDFLEVDGQENILLLRDVARGELYRPGRQILQIGGTSDRIELFRFEPSITKVVYADGSVDRIDDLPTTYTVPDSGGGSGNGDDPSGNPLGLPDIPLLYGQGEGTSGDDWIFGTDADDVLAGGPGIDILVGHRGVDVYLFNRGDGTDLIVDDDEEGVTNIIRFGPGIAEADLQISEESGLRMFVINGTEEGIAFLGPMPQFQFADIAASGDGGEEATGRAGAGEGQPSSAQPSEDASLGPIDGIPVSPMVREASSHNSSPDSLEESSSSDDALSFSAPVPEAIVGTSWDPLYRDIDQRLDVLLQVGRVNLGERYGEAIREFEERRRARELPTDVPEPTDAEIGAYNRAMHAWHGQHPGYGETEFGSTDGIATPGWGIPMGQAESVWGQSTNPFAPPTLANPHALQGITPVGSMPGLAEGLRTRL